MVIEGVLTTENSDGSMHVSPIGPHVNTELSTWTLKPFQSSKTFVNLRASSRAVFHVVDDPLLMAAAVLLPLFLPWLDRCRVKSIRYRGWIYKTALGTFARFLEVVSFSHGAKLNVSSVARECAVGRRTVENYVSNRFYRKRRMG